MKQTAVALPLGAESGLLRAGRRELGAVGQDQVEEGGRRVCLRGEWNK